MIHETHSVEEMIGLTGKETTFREALAAVVRAPKVGDDDDDDEWMGRCIGWIAGAYPNALSPLRALIWRPRRSDKQRRRRRTVSHRDWLDRTEREKMTQSLRFAVMERDGFRCRYCGVHVDDLEHDEALHIDHVVPIAAGGKTKKSNLVTACNACNRGKGVSGTKRFAGDVSKPGTQTVPNK